MCFDLVMMGFFLVLVELVGFIIACDGTSINSILPIFLDIVVVCFFVFPCVVLHISNDNTETNVGDNGKSENHTCHNEGTHPDSVLHVATSAATHQISSPVGVDSVNAVEETHLAWYATNANASLLEPPLGDTPSVQVVFPDNTTSKTNVSSFTGYHLTQGAFDGAEIDVDIGDGSFGHFLNSINNVSAPTDWSWYWQLHTWNDTSSEWEDAEVGMDSLDQPMTIAWASNNTSHNAIPEPGFAVIEDSECDGHGWIMGSGSSAHCMCDEGYEWAEDDILACIPVESEPEYTVGHYAYTYILDEYM